PYTVRAPDRALSLLAPLTPPPPASTLFPYTTLFRSLKRKPLQHLTDGKYFQSLDILNIRIQQLLFLALNRVWLRWPAGIGKITRSEEHTSELQSRENLVCRLLLEKKTQFPSNLKNTR